MKARFPAAAAGVLAALLIAAAAFVQHARELRYPGAEGAEESIYITSGSVLEHLTEGYHALAADLYWIRAIQYYGGTKHAASLSEAKAASTDYRLLYPLLDLTTTLDPRFNIVYRFGAIFLAEAPPAGPGRPDLAIALLEKGLKARPDKWEYMQDIGFVYYWWQRDYRAAADWFARAADVPGAPWWLRSLTAATMADAGDRRAARLMWESLRETGEIEWLRTDAERRLLQLRALDEIDALQNAIDRFVAATHSSPAGWAALVRAGVLRGTPLDPMQTPYEIGVDGRVHLSARSPLFPLPDQPKALPPPA